MKNQILVFIDAGVDKYHQLFDGVVAGATPFIVDTATDGIEQIDEILQQYSGQKTVHIISHGAPGCLYLGNSQLSLGTLKQYAPLLEGWDIDSLLLYGCHVAAGDAGEEFVSKLQGVTGANIAASQSLTGAAVQGGNWELEVSTGKVEVATALRIEVMGTYSGVFDWRVEFAQDADLGYRDLFIHNNGDLWGIGRFYRNIDIDGDGNNDVIANGTTYLVKFEVDGSLDFAYAVGLNSNNDVNDRIAIDDEGNVWVTGYFQHTMDIDQDGEVDLTSVTRDSDSYVIGFSSDGELLSAKGIGSSGIDYSTGIVTDSNGNVFATGRYQGNIDIDGDGNNDLTSDGSQEVYVIKFDSAGKFLYAQSIADGYSYSLSSSDNDQYNLFTDRDGNALVTGIFKGNIDIDGDGKDDLTSSSDGDSDIYVVKFDIDGDLLSSQSIGGSSNDSIDNTTADNNGNLFIEGSFPGNIDVDGDGNNDFISSDSSKYLVKLDNNSNFLYALNLPSAYDDIAIDINGNVWVRGSYEGSIDIDRDGEDDLISNGYIDGYLAKFNSNGTLAFTYSIGGSYNDDSIYDMVLDVDGNLWATGRFWGSMDIDGDGNNDLSSNDYDSYVINLDTNGNLLFAQSHEQISVRDMVTDANGNLLMAGSFQESIDIDGDGSNDLTSNEGSDGYLFQLDSNGDLQFAQSIGGSKNTPGGVSSGDYTNKTFTNSNGSVWVHGYVNWRGYIEVNGNNHLLDGTYIVKLSEGDDSSPPNSSPTDINLSNNRINENVAANTVVGTLSSVDPDAGDTFTYTLVAGTGDTDNSAFTIYGNQLKIKNSPDYESKSSYTIRVQTTDAEGASYQEQLTINVKDVNDTPENSAPTDIKLSNKRINENVAANTVVGTFSTVDPDTGDTFTYALVTGAGDTDNSAFSIYGNKLKIKSSPDYGSKSSYNIRVRTTDEAGASYQEQLTININDINEPPKDTEKEPLPGEPFRFDFNQDGVADIFWRQKNGDNQIWLMSDEGTWESAINLGKLNKKWNVSGVEDFNRDGVPDILWRHSNGNNKIWLMDDNGKLDRSVNPGKLNKKWDVAGVDDFNGDGVADILWHHPNGANKIWLMDDEGKRNSQANPGKVDKASGIAGVGDFNTDGVADILWRHPNGDNRIWLMDDDGDWDSSINLGNIGKKWDVAGVGDFNTDGVPDILWRHSNGAKQIWFMDDEGRFDSSVNLKKLNKKWDVAGIDDFSGDGVPDILWRHSNGANQIWFMDDEGRFESSVNPGSLGRSWNIAGI
ncbi:DUF4347 domain-containing protein [Okeania sp.]|uniref:DUF4347 domain-containing protein n=1 Tax=Okeania sp. TaxID=3100323 RepID=UPI002B4AB283|nr:DUF4347 domain-containing protein [Okeania sp.]MEB3339349.1 DUF4347 domain-containing protein [Okeania sp.]